MSTTKILTATALASVLGMPAMASTHLRNLLGEGGYDLPVATSQFTRAEVAAELKPWQANPVTANGWRFVGGEIGWAEPIHRYEMRNGKMVHSDTLEHNTPQPPLPSAADRKFIDSLYPRG